MSTNEQPEQGEAVASDLYRQACNVADWANAAGTSLESQQALYEAAARLRDTIGRMRVGAAPAPQGEPTGFIFRHKQQVAEAESIEPGQPHDHLWIYMHGTKYLSRMESSTGLEVVRLHAAPQTTEPAPEAGVAEALRLAGLTLIGLAEHDQHCEVFNLDDGGRHCACSCGLSDAIATITQAGKSAALAAQTANLRGTE